MGATYTGNAVLDRLIDAKVKKALEELRKKAEADMQKAAKIAAAAGVEIIIEIMKNEYMSLVDEFYGDYTPKKYIRNRSIYYLLETSGTSGSWSADVVNQGFSFPHGFTWIVEDGWHGGDSNHTYWGHNIAYKSNTGVKKSFDTMAPVWVDWYRPEIENVIKKTYWDTLAGWGYQKA